MSRGITWLNCCENDNRWQRRLSQTAERDAAKTTEPAEPLAITSGFRNPAIQERSVLCRPSRFRGIRVACTPEDKPDEAMKRTMRRAVAVGFALAILPLSYAVPVINITDLYHPHQDVGDNFDLIAAYALPEVDLKAVIFDVTDEYRKPVGQVAGLPADQVGPREPGYVAVEQLNRIFDRAVPCASAPFGMMRSPDDKMLDAPKFEQAGIDLLLRTLRNSTQTVEIVSFGSARPVAVAMNRDMELFRRKVGRIHLAAGSSQPGFMEWNVMLDPHAIVRVLRSDLPVAIYPCGTRDGAFAYGEGNTFWLLPNLRFVRDMAPPLQRYLAYAFERSSRIDFLRAVEHEQPASFTSATLERTHNVWETAVWLNVAGRKLVVRSDGTHRIVAGSELQSGDHVLPNDLMPCEVDVRPNGDYSLRAASRKTTKWMYYRRDPKANESALREALPAWYTSIRVPLR